MSAKLYVATDTVGESKAPAITTGSAEAFVSSPPVTILQDVFKLPDHIPKDMLTEAVKICQLAKERNKYSTVAVTQVVIVVIFARGYHLKDIVVVE
jgi:hypothetical protein